MGETIIVGNLQIAKPLYDLVCDDIVPNIALAVGISAETYAHDFWQNLEKIINELSPRNNVLLKIRDELQNQIDAWHLKYKNNTPIDLKEYKAFLKKIGYLQEESDDFEIATENVDDEIALIAGPQLVVPVNNARFALNAANARWGSLYDALYGSDVIPKKENEDAGFDQNRAHKVIEKSNAFLDKTIPLNNNESHNHVTCYSINEDNQLEIHLSNGKTSALSESSQFCGYQKSSESLILLFKNNNLHLELQIDFKHPIGKLHAAGIKDIVLESAITTIQDCEDSVTAVDAKDKVEVYRNWLGLMRGDLSESFEKAGKKITRKLNPDRTYQTPNGTGLHLSGRSLLLTRNVGHLMTSDAVLYSGNDKNEEIPEGILDAMITSLIALYDIYGISPYKNSKTNSIYIVKPKMHGPEEVAFTVELFSRVEQALKLPENTLKIGIMDEERRTTVNLKECIREAKNRIIFINTGFLDRTGDEIHTSMQAGPFLPKSDIKKQPWIHAYEDWNVDIGLACGLKGKAQIGKGMWAMPDEMANMMKEKINHLQAGANCAWIPSPTAATLHAMHYHQILVSDQQDKLTARVRASLDDILTIPLLGDKQLSPDEIQQELENNVQGILGYVVRWIDQGIGCSKVPDINNIGLMEDRATLRISSQLLANWLMHGICTRQQIEDTFQRMAVIVDIQNANDPFYTRMAPNYQTLAYQAALDLVFKGHQQPNGYTEPLLHDYRKKYKETFLPP